MEWKNYDSSSSIGKTGSEGGSILKDFEYQNVGRVTLEQLKNRYAITFGIYGHLVHTCFFDTLDIAIDAMDRIKTDIVDVYEKLNTKEKNRSQLDSHHLLKELVEKYQR